ncbi:MAG: monofunctional biosynthetic peptidoglycan transglycosylase, partial [Chitinophagaceae bacterium]
MFWKRFKKAVFWVLLLHLVYILACRFLNPPVTLTQIGNLQYGLKRDMISSDEMGNNIKLAVIAGEDQLFPVHNGFDVKRIKMAMRHNEKNPGRRRGAST